MSSGAKPGPVARRGGHHPIVPRAGRSLTCRVLLNRLSSDKVHEINNRKYCQLCHRSPSDDLLYGKIHVLGSVVVHYYCILFASYLPQNGGDDDGISGFLEQDIKTQIEKNKNSICSYCNEGGATIICVQRMCKKVFHMPCGLENGAQNNYYHKFQSFCKAHRPVVKGAINAAQDPEPVQCAICLEDVKKDSKCMSTVWASCCKKSAWIHRACVQKYTLSAGYFSKCPRCNNKNEFIRAMQRYGIYIPDRDAAWEIEGNQFDDLYRRSVTCSALLCVCPSGREVDDDDTDWELMICGACGAQGLHLGCSAFKTFRKWYCPQCKPIMQKDMQDAGTHALLQQLIHRPASPNELISDPEPNPGPSRVEEQPVPECSHGEPSNSRPHSPTDRPGSFPFSTEATAPPPPPQQSDPLPPNPPAEEDEDLDVEIVDDEVAALPSALAPQTSEIEEVFSQLQPPSKPRARPSARRKMPVHAIIIDSEDSDKDSDDGPLLIEEICKID